MRKTRDCVSSLGQKEACLAGQFSSGERGWGGWLGKKRKRAIICFREGRQDRRQLVMGTMGGRAFRAASRDRASGGSAQEDCSFFLKGFPFKGTEQKEKHSFLEAPISPRTPGGRKSADAMRESSASNKIRKYSAREVLLPRGKRESYRFPEEGRPGFERGGRPERTPPEVKRLKRRSSQEEKPPFFYSRRKR